MRSIFKVIYVLCIFAILPTFGQDISENVIILNEIYDKLDSKSSKKIVKKIERLVYSEKFSTSQISQINSILKSFDDRKFKFNSHYIYFFNFLMSDRISSLDNHLLNQYLNVITYCNINVSSSLLRSILQTTLGLIESNYISISDNFSWSTFGDFDFIINESQQPTIKFKDVRLLLKNNIDSLYISDVSGYYDFITNTIVADYGSSESHYVDGVLVKFDFFNFSLNLNKSFFSIKEAIIDASGPIYLKSSGVYKNKLTSSMSYPQFKTSLKVHNIELFKGVKTSGFISMKGTAFYIDSYPSSVNLHLKDDSVDCFFSSDLIQLQDGVISSIEGRFSIVFDNDSIYHPSVNFSYDDKNKEINIVRTASNRGLNPFRNTLHGLNMFVDKIQFNLIKDHAIFYHYSRARDIEVLFESNTYFDRNRYLDVMNESINSLMMLLDFSILSESGKLHSLKDFAIFCNLDVSSVIQLLIELEVFGFVDYFNLDQRFLIKSWATNFRQSSLSNFDYDYFKIQSLASIGDTVASIDLFSNEMTLMQVNKININNRFKIELYPISNQLIFTGNKSFKMDGNIYIGNFAFSGRDLNFDYKNFAFLFGLNSVLSFFDPSGKNISSSIIHFDSGTLYLDENNNKSGVKFLNNYPIFKTTESSYFSYINNHSQFLIDPFEITYLNDNSIDNLTFDGSLFLDEVCDGLDSKLYFNSNNNLISNISTDTLVDLYKDNVRFHGTLDLNEDGLFANGSFFSDKINFHSKKMKLDSGYMIGVVDSCENGDALVFTPFDGEKNLLSYSPYDNSFLVNSSSIPFMLYDKFLFSGDLYFDGSNLNASGELYSSYLYNKSSHYYLTKDNIMSADASFKLFNHSDVTQFITDGVSLEYDLVSNNILLHRSNVPFSLPLIQYESYFDFAAFDMNINELQFYSNKDEGLLISYSYGKDSFSYQSLGATYYLNSNTLCVYNIFPLSIKGFWIQPEKNEVCIDSQGDFPIFNNATLIKKRFLFSDKLFHNKDILIKPSLRHTLINE
jgi:hypothetical protein